MEKAEMILYHANCADGFCSAWITHKATLDNVMVAVQYGQPMPHVRDGEVVYILDFSYPAAALIELAERSTSVVVLDHHKTAQKGLEGVSHPRLQIVFDMEKSGAMLTWQYFHTSEEVPLLVQYIEDRDLWRWKLANSREVSAAIASYPYTIETWDWLMSAIDSKDLVVEGSAILRYQRGMVERIAGKAREGVIAGHRCGVINSCVLQSELGEKIGSRFGIGVVWMEVGNGEFVYSLRSTTVDVSAIAAGYGGGGHAGAAGFKSNKLLQLCAP